MITLLGRKLRKIQTFVVDFEPFSGDTGYTLFASLQFLKMNDEELSSVIENHLDESFAINNPRVNFITCLAEWPSLQSSRFVNATLTRT